MNTIFRNVRHAFRVLRRAPGFSLTAVATLALGIGAATAMFTIVNSVLLRPLPFHDADRVAAIYTRYDPESGYNFPQFSLSGPEFLDYRAQTRVLSDVAAYNRAGVTFATDDAAMEPIRGFQVQATANLFSTLGVEAALGRTFRAGDDQPGDRLHQHLVVFGDLLAAPHEDPGRLVEQVRVADRPDHRHDLVVQDLPIARRVLVPHDEIGGESLEAPVRVRLDDLAHQLDVCDVGDPHQHDRQIA